MSGRWIIVLWLFERSLHPLEIFLSDALGGRAHVILARLNRMHVLYLHQVVSSSPSLVPWKCRHKHINELMMLK